MFANVPLVQKLHQQANMRVEPVHHIIFRQRNGEGLCSSRKEGTFGIANRINVLFSKSGPFQPCGINPPNLVSTINFAKRRHVVVDARISPDVREPPIVVKWWTPTPPIMATMSCMTT